MLTFIIFAILFALDVFRCARRGVYGIDGSVITCGERARLCAAHGCPAHVCLHHRVYAPGHPLFILAGNLMNTGGTCAKAVSRPGFDDRRTSARRIGTHANIIASMIFSGMSGAVVADAAGLGQIEISAMDDAGYDRKFSAAITAASSTIGPIIPPSIPFVIYGSLTGLSVGKLWPDLRPAWRWELA